MPASGVIQVSNLPPGMYLLTLFLTDGRTYRKKSSNTRRRSLFLIGNPDFVSEWDVQIAHNQ